MAYRSLHVDEVAPDLAERLRREYPSTCILIPAGERKARAETRRRRALEMRAAGESIARIAAELGVGERWVNRLLRQAQEEVRA